MFEVFLDTRPAYKDMRFGLAFLVTCSLAERWLVCGRSLWRFLGGVLGLFVLCPDEIMIVLDAFVECVRGLFGKTF